jgi:hypothetical protein
MSHLTPEQLEALLMGPPPAEAAEWRRHLAGCEACARRLAAGARFEEQLEQAAARPAVARRAKSRFALAAAAALVVLLAAFPAMRFVSRNGELTQAPRVVPEPLPTPAVFAAGVPGLTARIPRPCDDCRRPDGAAGAEHEPPCIACRTPLP